MLATVDVGNSEIAIGLFENNDLLKTWRLTTTLHRTGDEWALLIKSLLADAGQALDHLDGVCISSVVPLITNVLEHVFKDLRVVFVTPGTSAGVNIEIDNPNELGSDRIANAVAAHKLFAKNCIIADFGTATTIDAVSFQGNYLGGAIAPGIGISAEALFRSGAQLNQTILEPPSKKLGKTTAQSIRSGIIWGTVSQVDGLAAGIIEELGWRDALCIATGGFSGFIYPYSGIFKTCDLNLTLKGLKLAYEYYS